METRKLNDNTYEVQIYDWIHTHDDYVCGHVIRDLTQDEGSDLRYWLFYPAGTTSPINAGDMARISRFIAELNTD